SAPRAACSSNPCARGCSASGTRSSGCRSSTRRTSRPLARPAYTPTSTPPHRRRPRMAMSPVATGTEIAPGALTGATFANLEKLAELPRFRVQQNAVTQVTVDDIALNREIVFNTDHSFSNVLDDWSVTNQKQSGRCWMFAGLNLFRPGAMEQMGLKSFE